MNTVYVRDKGDAISTLEKLHSKDMIGVLLYLAASHAALGHTDQARATMASVIRLDPLATVKRLAPTFLAPYQNASDRDHLRENQGGVADCSPRTTPYGGT